MDLRDELLIRPLKKLFFCKSNVPYLRTWFKILAQTGLVLRNSQDGVHMPYPIHKVLSLQCQKRVDHVSLNKSQSTLGIVTSQGCFLMSTSKLFLSEDLIEKMKIIWIENKKTTVFICSKVFERQLS